MRTIWGGGQPLHHLQISSASWQSTLLRPEAPPVGSCGCKSNLAGAATQRPALQAARAGPRLCRLTCLPPASLELPACCRPAAAGLACLPPGHACTCGTPSQLLHPRIPWVSWPKISAARRGTPATHWPCRASPWYRSTWHAAPAVLPLHCHCGASVFDPEAAALAGCRTGCTGRLPDRAQPQLVRSRRGAAHRWAAGPPPEPAAAAQAPAQ